MKPPIISDEGKQAVANIATARANKNAGGSRVGGTYVAPVAPVPTPNTSSISTSSLAPAEPMKLGTPAVPTEAPKLAADFQAQTDQYTADLEAQAKAAQAPTTDARSKLTEYMAGLKGVNQLTNEAYAAPGGVDAITPELNDINDQIRREQRSLDLAKRNITERGGGLASGAASEISNLERVSLQKQADLSIIQMAVQGRYDSAKTIADRAVSAQFEEETQKLANLQFNYDENKELFTKAEQRAFEAAQTDRQNKLAEEKQNKQDMYNLGLQASADGAPQSVVTQMFAAKTREEALAIGGSYIGALDREAQRANIAQSYASIAASNATRKAAENAQTPLQLSEVIQSSISDSNPVTIKSSLAALLGTDKIAAGTKGRISPALAVLNAVDEFANSNPEGQFTGVGFGGRIKEGIKGFFNMKSPEATINEQNIEAINLKVQQWASGASLTETQTKQVDRLTPKLGDSDKIIKSKTNGLYNFMLNQTESDLLTDGINVQFPSVNLFEISDLYAKADPEQKMLIEAKYFVKP